MGYFIIQCCSSESKSGLLQVCMIVQFIIFQPYKCSIIGAPFLPRFLRRLMLPETDYTTVIVAFWAIETVYQKCFSLCLEEESNTPRELLETCQRWGNSDFGRYCYSLQKIVTRCLEKAPQDAVRMAEEAFLNVLEYEVNFWNMSTADS